MEALNSPADLSGAREQSRRVSIDSFLSQVSTLKPLIRTLITRLQIERLKEADQHSEELTLCELMIKEILGLSEAVLSANVFSWSEFFYKQRRDLAVICRIAPLLAVAFMYKIEAMTLRLFPHIYTCATSTTSSLS